LSLVINSLYFSEPLLSAPLDIGYSLKFCITLVKEGFKLLSIGFPLALEFAAEPYGFNANVRDYVIVDG
jgi:hypothetical protein